MEELLETVEILPKGWVSEPLGDLTEYAIGGAWGLLPEEANGKDFIEVACIRGADIRDWEVRKATSAVSRALDAKSFVKRKLELGDILVEISGGGPDQPVGRTILIDEEALESADGRTLVPTNFLRLLRLRHDVNPAYVNHFLKYFYFAGDIGEYQGGSSNLRNLRFKDYITIEVPLAPLPEQRRIVEAIELQLGRLDAAVARLHAAKAKLKRYKQAVLKAAFTENDWPVTSIGDVYEVFVGSTPSRAKPELWNGNVPWVSSGEVAFCELHDTREKIAQEALGNSEKRLHPSGTVMLAMIGEGKTRGQAAILRIAAAHNQNTAAIRMPDSLHSPEYLYYFFLYEYENTRRVGSGNNQMALNKSRIQDIEIPMPDPETQARIALEIAGRLDEVDAIESTLDAQLAQSTRLRQAVLKRAFEGRLG